MISIIKNERGGVSLTLMFWFMGIFPFIVLFAAILLDKGAIYYLDKKYSEAVDDTNHDLYRLIDIQNTAFNVDMEITDDVNAKQQFNEIIQRRLSPDNNKFITGPAKVDQIHIVKMEDLPFNDGHGDQMTHPGIVSEITVPIKTPIFGIKINDKILVTTEIFR
ncbi:hypothetical protein NSQ59_27315 [Margalitia sp. FSL K6-0131]|uniref:hypothetical protein n=1 Tax=Margalitia sp. FSL K6-0131 TaxID=2954604 RepID=UPI0030F89240